MVEIVAAVAITIAILGGIYIFVKTIEGIYNKKLQEKIVSLGVCPYCGQVLGQQQHIDARSLEEFLSGKKKTKNPVGFAKPERSQ
jgi:hypothetical protein